MILSIQCVDGDVDQMEDYFTAIHVSVRVLWCIENMSLCCIVVHCTYSVLRKHVRDKMNNYPSNHLLLSHSKRLNTL